ncbi:hypothetical protein VPHK567_0273 [Vibrio phage K567]|nr:hypothetical protein MYOV011v1_p0350 [Vibrio phage 6E35.1a]
MLLETVYHLMNDNVYTTLAVIIALTAAIMVGIETKIPVLIFIPTVLFTFLGTVGLFYVPIGALS